MPNKSRPFRAVDAFFMTIEKLSDHDDRTMQLIRLALTRALVKADAVVMINTGLDEMVEFRTGDTISEACGTALLEEEVFERASHVIDWIVAAVRNDAPWLSRTDREGRPVKLVKLATLDRAVAEADKAMRIFAEQNRKLVLVEGAEEVHAELGDGWNLVRLLTPEALDLESGHMQHCIGQGGFDDKLENGSSLFLSLRDPTGNPHATIEMDGRKLVQLQGKQNVPPIGRYLTIMRSWLRENVDVDPKDGNRHVWWSGHLIDSQGVFHEFDALPEQLVVNRELSLQAGPDRPLPAMLLSTRDTGSIGIDGEGAFTMPSMTKGTRLLLSNGHPTFPAGAVVEANTIRIHGCTVDGLKDLDTDAGFFHIQASTVDGLPEGLHAQVVTIENSSMEELPSLGYFAQLTLIRSDIGRIPATLEIGSLFVEDCPKLELPKGMTCVDMNLSGTEVVGIDADTRIKGRLTIVGPKPVVVELPEGMVVGSLNVIGWDGGKLPEGMVVNGNAVLSGYRYELPEKMTVRGQLTLDGRHVTHLPDGLEVTGRVVYAISDKLPTIGPEARIGSDITIVSEDAEHDRADSMSVSELEVVRPDAGMRL